MTLPSRRQSALLALALAGLLMWLWYGGSNSIEPGVFNIPGEMEGETPPETWSRALKTTQYTLDGEIDYILEAGEQVQEREDLIRVMAPVLRLFDESRQRWQASAVSGTIHGTGENSTDQQLVLTGDVRVDYTDDRGRALLMTTERMTVYPDDEILHSNSAVQVLGPGFEQSAAGMRAALQEERLTFFGRVQGRFHEE